jgi:hypothetical protein
VQHRAAPAGRFFHSWGVLSFMFYGTGETKFPRTTCAFTSLRDCHMVGEAGRMLHAKYWKIIANNLSKAGWSLGWVSAMDSNGRTIWIVDARRGDGKRSVVHADEKLTAFLELESAILRLRRIGLTCGAIFSRLGRR